MLTVDCLLLSHPGSILLLHAISKDNAEALAKIIDDLREKGYHLIWHEVIK